ncbi:glycine betaine ABC transporter substrate-binding protein [Microbacterium oryzae]|uniref:glycine betaine ABC transporter substrate-binding protein n=1 Tax=Microbacterium oryzae TaxID=743009 RepID=UPI0025B2562F|nr:glycine betaine ABC transporter substrate-binding protein [Microbacterium oryzae]MDN3309476.1 glycine betaine ABC transporter substrate-binding protein [Microbacterium oryzae]
MKNTTTRMLAAGSLTAVTALALAGCSGGEAASDDRGEEVTIAVFNGWAESMVSSELWKAVLEQKGYDVELVPADPAPVFAGLASGDYDLATQVSLPTLHADYVAQFGDALEDLGAWYDKSSITVAVNEDAPIDSLDEFLDNADAFGNRIVGIEAGAGQTQLMESDVLPGYGLESVDFPTSSTPAMLAELDAAISNGENIAVSLWEPHWAYAVYPLKNLEDPKGLLGEPELLHTFAREGFSDDHAEVAGWLRDFQMDEERLLDLEELLFVDNDTDEYGPIVDAWIEENQDYVDSLTS